MIGPVRNSLESWVMTAPCNQIDKALRAFKQSIAARTLEAGKSILVTVEELGKISEKGISGDFKKLSLQLTLLCKEILTVLNQKEISAEEAQSLRLLVNEALKTLKTLRSRYKEPSKEIDAANPTVKMVSEIEAQDSKFLNSVEGFLNELSYQINTQVDGRGACQELGKTVLNMAGVELGKKPDCNTLHDALSKMFEKIDLPCFDHGLMGKLEFLMETMCNPYRGLCTFLDINIGSENSKLSKIVKIFDSSAFSKVLRQLGECFFAFGKWVGRKLLYNAYAHENRAYKVCEYEISTKGNKQFKVTFNQAPSAAMDELSQAQRQHQKIKGESAVVHSVESNPDVRGEKERRTKNVRAAQDDKGTILQITPLNGDAVVGEGAFSSKKARCVEGYHAKLKEFCLDSKVAVTGQSNPYNDTTFNGFVRVNSALTEVEIEGVIGHSKQICMALYGVDSWGPKDHALRCKTMALSFQTLLIIKELSKLRCNATMTQACKQDVDRGPIVNIMTQVYLKLMNGEGFTEADIQLWAGQAMRAGIVDQRMMNKECQNPLLELLGQIGKNQARVTALLKGFAALNDATVKISSPPAAG
jgi:hypothetical protein